jgi:hypothetical protein
MAKVALMICKACRAKWLAANWHGTCPACRHNEAEKADVDEKELA